ncbi:MAG: exodeoxyribonuclease V subunit alpha [Kiritimatiellae bacterium]|nr:exodeoxyribonuclease V subunit alpha [Kiritimatiellia bacterium]
MTVEEAERRLRLFGIPGNGEGEDDIRQVLSRILARGSLALSDLQTARDIVEHLKAQDVGLYLFLAAMQLSLKDGNTFLRLENGAELLKAAGHQENGQAQEKYAELVDKCWDKYAESAGERLVQEDGQLVICKNVGESVKGWFFAKVWDSVKVVSDRLCEMAGEEDFGELSENYVRSAVLFKGKDRQFSLNAEQQKAVRMVGRRRFVVVTGGPGTGKTTVVCAILRALMAQGDVVGEDIALVAPTGRAGQRMGESIHGQCAIAVGMLPEIRRQIEELSGATIHSTLGGLPPNWKYTKENRLPHKLVIVDESSMVDVHLMKALLDALPDKCRLVLLGDKDQLPSVDAGAVLGDVVANFDERTVVELKESNRFTGALADCARAVNAGDAACFEKSIKRLPLDGETWTETLSKGGEYVNRVFYYELAESVKPEAFRDLMLEWVRSYGLLAENGNGLNQADDSLASAAEKVGSENDVFKDGTKTTEVLNLFELLGRSRILTVVREGTFGAVGINDLVITARFGGRRPTNPLAKVGVPVMVTRNTRERNLWNGDIGVTVEGPNGMVVLFPRGEKTIACPVALLPEHELAYAMTVHKSQGSEFENVMVVLPNDENHPLLNRQIVYTGITRAKKRAVVVGTQAALTTALSRRLVRDTGLALRNV